jgi:glyoxylase-like metal-dependent hydrolase (beta-lactamase superfamily II)
MRTRTTCGAWPTTARCFPNASYFIGNGNFWMAEDTPDKHVRRFALGAKRGLSRVKDRLKTVKPGDDIIGGVRIVDTPGHISLEVAGGDGLSVVGDVVANAAVSFAQPEWRFAIDSVPDMAIASRRRLLDRAATEKTRLLGSHWPFPGLDMGERKGQCVPVCRGELTSASRPSCF